MNPTYATELHQGVCHECNTERPTVGHTVAALLRLCCVHCLALFTNNEQAEKINTPSDQQTKTIRGRRNRLATVRQSERPTSVNRIHYPIPTPAFTHGCTLFGSVAARL